MNYPGGKNGAGVYQQIINQMPPHETYIETHLGSGAVMRRKRPAAVNIGLEIDPSTLATFSEAISPELVCCSIVKNVDAVPWLKSYRFTGRELVYSDPPYIMESRKGGKLYRHEYSDEDHIALLDVLTALPCMVMISGYWSRLYADRLAGWRVHTFEAQTRRGMATEWLWMNYPEPKALHDYQFIGDNFRERERIKRKANRWAARLESLPPLERKAVMSQLLSS